MRLLEAAAAVCAVIVAFLRGKHLLGNGYGVLYAASVLAIVWLLLVRSRTPFGNVSRVRAGFVSLFGLVVGYVMAFPASINPSVQFGIDMQATDRAARAELAAVFESDSAYRDLSVSSVHLKALNIEIRGALDKRSDLDRLRSRIGAECPNVGLSVLHWDIALRNTGQRVDGVDRELFPGAEAGDSEARRR